MPTPTTKPTRLIALMNQKGGVGKTTTTVNLAAAFAKAGRRTLVVDLDPQAHATLHVGVDPATARDHGPTVYDLLTDRAADPRAAVHSIDDNLGLIPSETDLAGAESELTQIDSAQRRLADALAPIASGYEFILLDCPPSLGLLTINGLVAAREVLIPMQAHFLALQGVGKLLETVTMLRGTAEQPGLNPRLRVSGVILCMHDRQATHTQEVVGDLHSFFKDARDNPDVPWRYARVFNPAIRRNIKLAECPSFGQTIFQYAPDANGAADYQALATGMLDEWDRLFEHKSAASSPPPSPSGPSQDQSAARSDDGGDASHAPEINVRPHESPTPTP